MVGPACGDSRAGKAGVLHRPGSPVHVRFEPVFSFKPAFSPPTGGFTLLPGRPASDHPGERIAFLSFRASEARPGTQERHPPALAAPGFRLFALRTSAGMTPSTSGLAFRPIPPYHPALSHAGVAELVDALDLGKSASLNALT